MVVFITKGDTVVWDMESIRNRSKITFHFPTSQEVSDAAIEVLSEAKSWTQSFHAEEAPKNLMTSQR